MVLEEMPFNAIQNGHHGSHLEYKNETILAIWNLHVALILPAKCMVSPTYMVKPRKFELQFFKILAYSK